MAASASRAFLDFSVIGIILAFYHAYLENAFTTNIFVVKYLFLAAFYGVPYWLFGVVWLPLVFVVGLCQPTRQNQPEQETAHLAHRRESLHGIPLVPRCLGCSRVQYRQRRSVCDKLRTDWARCVSEPLERCDSGVRLRHSCWRSSGTDLRGLRGGSLRGRRRDFRGHKEPRDPQTKVRGWALAVCGRVVGTGPSGLSNYFWEQQQRPSTPIVTLEYRRLAPRLCSEVEAGNYQEENEAAACNQWYPSNLAVARDAVR